MFLRLILIVTLFTCPIVSFAQDPEEEDLEPAWSETQAYREYMAQQWVLWTLDDELNAMYELIKAEQSLDSGLPERLQLLQQRVSMLQQAKKGSHQAKRALLKQFFQFYIMHGIMLRSDKLLGVDFMDFLDHMLLMDARLKLFRNLNETAQ